MVRRWRAKENALENSSKSPKPSKSLGSGRKPLKRAYFRINAYSKVLQFSIMLFRAYFRAMLIFKRPLIIARVRYSGLSVLSVCSNPHRENTLFACIWILPLFQLENYVTICLQNIGTWNLCWNFMISKDIKLSTFLPWRDAFQGHFCKWGLPLW